MAAATDLFQLGTNNFSTTLSSAITATTLSIPLTAVTNLPTTTGITLVIDRISSTGTPTPSLREYVGGIISSSDLVMPSTAYRGLGGSTAQSHLSGAVVEAVWDQTQQNNLMNGLLTTLTQTGALQPGIVTASKIANNTITATQIANNTITATQIANNTITATQIANNTIGTSQIASGGVLGANIAPNTVTGNNLVGTNLRGYNGAILGSPPGAPSGQFYMAAGTSVVACNVNSVGTLDFGTTFPNGVISVVICPGDNNYNALNYEVINSSVQTSTCNFVAFTGTTGLGALSIRVNYIVIGF